MSSQDHSQHFLPERNTHIEILASFYQHFVQKKRVLDLGCGDGIISERLFLIYPHIQLVAVDGSEEMLSAAQKRLAVYDVENFIKMPFEDIIEYSCSRWRQLKVKTDWAVRTNHAMIGRESSKKGKQPRDTWSRYNRLAQLLKNSYNSGRSPTPSDLKAYLADDRVERRDETFATAYSVVVCPATSRTEFTLGGQPVASCGNWSHIAWPWQ